MHTPHFDATAELAIIRQKQAVKRRKKHYQSSLNKHRAEIVALRKIAKPASYREIQEWLRTKKHLTIDHKTIWHFVQQLPELQDDQTVEHVN